MRELEAGVEQRVRQGALTAEHLAGELAERDPRARTPAPAARSAGAAPRRASGELGIASPGAGAVRFTGPVDRVLEQEADRGDLVGQRDPRHVLPPVAQPAEQPGLDQRPSRRAGRRRRPAPGRCAGGRRARRPSRAGLRRGLPLHAHVGQERVARPARARRSLARRCRRSSRRPTRRRTSRGPPYCGQRPGDRARRCRPGCAGSAACTLASSGDRPTPAPDRHTTASASARKCGSTQALRPGPTGPRPDRSVSRRTSVRTSWPSARSDAFSAGADQAGRAGEDDPHQAETQGVARTRRPRAGP